MWGRYPAGHQGVLALACPPSTATLCPPVASTEGAAGRRQAWDAQTSGWAGRGQARFSRDPDLWVLSFSASSAIGQAAQPEPAATHVPRSMAQPLRARGSSFPHCHGLEAQREVAGSGSPSPPLGGGNSQLPPVQPGPGERGSWTRSRREQRWAVPAEGDLLLESWPGSPQEQSLAREAERSPDGWCLGSRSPSLPGRWGLRPPVGCPQSPFPEGTALPSLTRGGNGPAAAGRLASPASGRREAGRTGCEGCCPAEKEEVLQRSLAPGRPGTGPIPHVPGRSCEWEAASCQPPQHLQCWRGGDQAGPEEGRGAADCVLLDAPLTLEHPHAVPNAYQGPLGEKA